MAKERTAGAPWRGARLVGGLGCGVLVAVSLPPWGWWPLAWLGFAGLALLLVRAGRWTRAGIGLAMGAGQYAIAVWWVTEFQPAGYAALVVLSALSVAAAVMVVPSRRFRDVAIGLPAAMVVADWARDRYPLGGSPLGGPSLGQARSPLVPVTRVGGSLALTGLAVLAGVVIAGAVLLVAAGLGRRASGRALGGELAATAAVVASVLIGWGSPSGGPVTRSIRVALVQGGGPRGTRAIYTNPDLVFTRETAASAGIEQPVALVVWPEGALQTHVDYRVTNGAATLSALARRLDATVIAGVEQDLTTHRYSNAVVVWGPDGRIVASYEKNHLVPFGEYIPARSLLGRFFSLKLVPRDAIAGHGPGFVRTPVAPLGVMISYEVFFDGRARGAVTAGGQLLVVPTNTSSYADDEVPTQEVAAAQLRAWETGRTALQVTPTGYTAVIGPSGQIVRQSSLDKPAVVQASVALRRGMTVYVSLGDDPVVVGATAALAVAWLIERRRPGGAARPGRRDAD